MFTDEFKSDFWLLSGFRLGSTRGSMGKCQKLRSHFSMPSFVSVLLSATKIARIFTALLFKLSVLSWAHFRQTAINPLQTLWLTLRDSLLHHYMVVPIVEFVWFKKIKHWYLSTLLTACLFLQLWACVLFLRYHKDLTSALYMLHWLFLC